MSKLLATCAALAVTALIALPGPAGAAESGAPGASKAGDIEVSAARRYHRRHVRVTVRPAYRYSRRYQAPYGPHPFDLYANSHPYFVPGAPVGAAGLRHDGMGTGAYGFGYQ
jgi:hypothetical protein